MGKKLNTEAVGSELKKNYTLSLLVFCASAYINFLQCMRAYLSYRAAGLPEEPCSSRKGPHRWNLGTLTCRNQAKMTASRGLPRQNLSYRHRKWPARWRSPF